MCTCCEKLLDVEEGHKARSIIKQINNELIEQTAEMVVDHYPHGIKDIFIHVEEYDKKNFLWKNFAFEINNCPMCGQRLA